MQRLFTFLGAVLSMRGLYTILAIIAIAFVAWRMFRFFRPARRTIKRSRVRTPDGRMSEVIDTDAEKVGWFRRIGRKVGRGVLNIIALIVILSVLVVLGALFAYIPDAVAVIGIFVVFFTLWIPLVILILWKTGYLRNLFFEIETDNVGFVDAGETNVFTYANVPHKILRKNVIVDGVLVRDWVLIDEEEEGQWEREKTWIQKRFGLYWVGFKFLNRRVHLIPITKKKAAAEIKPDMKPEEWITGDDKVVKIDQLRSKFPRPVLVPDLKFNDAVEANLLLLGNFELVVPRRPVYSLKGDFFDTLVNYVRAAMKDVAQRMDSDKFRVIGQVEGGQMSEDLRELINQKLIETCGVRLRGASIPVYNLSSDLEERAAKQAKLEEQQGRARLKRQEFDNLVLVSKARAQADADRITGEASVTDVKTLANHFDSLGASPDVAATSATALGRAVRYTAPGSPVTTQVEGGGATIAIPPTDKPERRVVLTDEPPPKHRGRK